MNRITTLLAALAMVFGLADLAQAYTFVPLDIPGASTTSARGINGACDAGALKGDVI